MRSASAAGALLLLAAMTAGAHAGDDQTIARLKQELRRKNAEIRRLKARLEVYEARGNPPNPATPGAQVSPANSPPAATAAVRAPSPTEQAKLHHALESALVQQGAALLPRWVVQVTPEFDYVHSDITSSSAIRNAFIGTLGLRLGLPWVSQVDLSVPYAFKFDTDLGHTSGIGDVQLEYDKQLFYQKGSVPSLIAALGWGAPTGTFGLNEVAHLHPIDTHVFSAGLTAVEKKEPLVFIGGLSGAVPLGTESAGSRFAPGNIYGGKLGVNLVATPDTTLSFGFNLDHVGVPAINGIRVPRWEPIIGTANIGLGTFLFGKQFINLSAQFRVTGSAPDLDLGIAVPVRF